MHYRVGIFIYSSCTNTKFRISSAQDVSHVSCAVCRLPYYEIPEMAMSWGHITRIDPITETISVCVVHQCDSDSKYLMGSKIK